MRITQAHISPSVSDFNFHGRLGLDIYHDRDQPCIFFGLYSEQDLLNVLRHKNRAIICWCGHDAATFQDWDLVYHLTHICCHQKIYDKLLSLGIRATLFAPNNLVGGCSPVTLGPKVYAYCPMTAPQYHGVNELINLKTKYEILIGDGSIPRHKWNPQEIYSQCFVGLVLSDWCGGAQSIIEMGLHGMRVVTNVLTLPNCIPWKTIEDIEKLIKQESARISQINTEITERTLYSLDTTLQILEPDNYGR